MYRSMCMYLHIYNGLFFHSIELMLNLFFVFIRSLFSPCEDNFRLSSLFFPYSFYVEGLYRLLYRNILLSSSCVRPPPLKGNKSTDTIVKSKKKIRAKGVSLEKVFASRIVDSGECVGLAASKHKIDCARESNLL